MDIIALFRIWLFLLLIVRAFVVPAGRDGELNLTEISLLPSQSSLIHRLNQTLLSPSIPANKPAVFCDGDLYGRDLDVADCKDAITGIKRTRQQLRFGERDTGQRTWDVGLPFRQIGSEHAVQRKSLLTSPCHLTSK